MLYYTIITVKWIYVELDERTRIKERQEKVLLFLRKGIKFGRKKISH